jgi:hypothetical protein
MRVLVQFSIIRDQSLNTFHNLWLRQSGENTLIRPSATFSRRREKGKVAQATDPFFMENLCGGPGSRIES